MISSTVGGAAGYRWPLFAERGPHESRASCPATGDNRPCHTERIASCPPTGTCDQTLDRRGLITPSLRRIQGRERAWRESFTAYAGSRRKPNRTLRGRRALDNECAWQLQREGVQCRGGRAVPVDEGRSGEARCGAAPQTAKASNAVARRTDTPMTTVAVAAVLVVALTRCTVPPE
jgi:hypothetical protein